MVSRPGAPCPDAPVGDGYLLEHLDGGFTLLCLGDVSANDVEIDGITAKAVEIAEPSAPLRARYLGDDATAVYLIRPDQHVVARWSVFDAAAVRHALRNAIGKAA